MDEQQDELARALARTEALERRLAERELEARSQLVKAEVKSHALRAGMVDLDGLKLVDLDQLVPDEQGEVPGVAELISGLKKRKPWLFGEASSSSTAKVPPSAPVRQKLATEMSEDEWRAARADVLRRR